MIKKMSEEGDSTTLETSHKVAKWIHHRLQTNGKIYYSEVEKDDNLNELEKYILVDALNGLVVDKILHEEKTFDDINKRVERVFYSKNIVL
jgi:hypothetical protein